MDLSRRDLLTFGGATLAAGTLAPTLTWGQAPPAAARSRSADGAEPRLRLRRAVDGGLARSL